MCWELGMKLLKERDMEAYKEEKREVKRCIYQTNNKANNQFGKKMKQYVGGNRKLFLVKVGMANGRKVEKCSRIKDENGRLVVGEDEVRRTWSL